VSVIRVGSSEKYASGWDKAFGGAKPAKKATAEKAAPKKAAPKATKKKAKAKKK
jgi:hypothetical protein